MARNHIPSFILRDGHEEQLGSWSCFPDSKSGICLGTRLDGLMAGEVPFCWPNVPITSKSGAKFKKHVDADAELFPFLEIGRFPQIFLPTLFSKRTCSWKHLSRRTWNATQRVCSIPPAFSDFRPGSCGGAIWNLIWYRDLQHQETARMISSYKYPCMLSGNLMLRSLSVVLLNLQMRRWCDLYSVRKVVIDSMPFKDI